MKNKKENKNMRGSKIAFMLLLAMLAILVTSSVADAVTSADISRPVTGGSVTVGGLSQLQFVVPMNIQNLSSVDSTEIEYNGQQGVNSLSFHINGTLCQTLTMGLWQSKLNCNGNLSTANAQGSANVSITNNGATSQILSAKILVGYRQNDQILSVTDISTLATKTDIYQANTTLHTRFTTVDTNIAAVKNETNDIYNRTVALKNETNTIYTDIHSNTWKDSLAVRIWLSGTRTLTALAQSIITLS